VKTQARQDGISFAETFWGGIFFTFLAAINFFLRNFW